MTPNCYLKHTEFFLLLWALQEHGLESFTASGYTQNEVLSFHHFALNMSLQVCVFHKSYQLSKYCILWLKANS